MPHKTPQRCLVIDDHPIFRRGLVELLRAEGHVVVGEGAGEDAVDLPAKHPDAVVAIVDVAMPGVDGVTMVKGWRAAGHPLRVIFLSLHGESHIVRAALDACGSGGAAYLLKERAESEVLAAIVAVVDGKRYVSAPLQAALSGSDELEVLSAAERKVLRHLADNKTSGEIAAMLGLSHRTVQNHRANAARKLGLSGPNRLLQFALERRERIVAEG
jgi:DNA-binding NarL/FixJ family response regulator